MRPLRVSERQLSMSALDVVLITGGGNVGAVTRLPRRPSDHASHRTQGSPKTAGSSARIMKLVMVSSVGVLYRRHLGVG